METWRPQVRRAELESGVGLTVGFVPRLANFNGVVVDLYFGDHPPPHVHAFVGRPGTPGVPEARFSIETGEPLNGELPRAKVVAVRRWCLRHREELLADFDRAQRYEHPTGSYD